MYRAAVLFVVVLSFNLAASAQTGRGIQQGSIVGVVTTGQNKAAANVRIEVRDMMSGTLASSTYTNESGGFEVDNLAFGNYELMAFSGLSESREQIQLRSSQTNVNLRVDSQTAGSDAGSSANTVSVSDFKVPKKAREAFHKAELAIQSFKIDEAMTHVTRALELYPRYAAAMTLRGIVKMDKSSPRDAIPDLEQAIQYDPGYAMAYLALGAAYNTVSRFDDSIRTTDRGIALSPTAWQGYFELGKSYVGKGDFATAIKQLNKAEDMAPRDFALVHLVKAHAMLGLKDYSQAMLELESYLTKRPQGPESEAARKTLSDVRSFVAHKGNQ